MYYTIYNYHIDVDMWAMDLVKNPKPYYRMNERY